MKSVTIKILIGLSLVFANTFAMADEIKDSLIAMAKNEVQGWLSNDIVINNVKAQNAKNKGMSEADIISLDKQWRAETSASSQPLISKVLGTELSSYLAGVKENSAGVYTEIFVMDAAGLNVGQSDVTSDYWQGDEAKWQKTYQVGPKAYHISEVEMDESSQQLQVQLSLPVVENSIVIGAVTIGINVDAL